MTELSPETKVPPSGKRAGRRRRRLLLLIGGGVFALLVLVLVLAPAIAGAVAPGMISDAAASHINGKVTVSRVSLSWFGSQKIGPVTVQDDRGQIIAKISAESGRGLLSLVQASLGLGPMDLGRISISGDAEITRSADGSTTFDRLLKQPAATASGGLGPKKELRLPKGLAGELDVSALNIRLINEGEARREILIDGLTASAKIASSDVTMALKAPAFSVEAAGPPRAAGVLTLAASVTSLFDSSGLFTPDAAKVDLNIDASDLSTEIAGVLSGIGKPLVDGLGETAKVSITATGGLASGRGALTIESKGLHANVGLTIADGTLTSTAPGTINMSGAAVAALVPPTLLADSGVMIEGYPGVDVGIDTIRIPMPQSGSAPDWKSAAATLTVRTSPTIGRFAPSEGQSRRLTIGAVETTITVSDLASGAAMRAKTTIALDDAPAGTVELDVNATNILDAAGAIKPAIPTLAGTLKLNDVSTVAAQTFVNRTGIDLPAGIGPKIDVAAVATPGASAGRTDVVLTLKSTGLNGSFTAGIDGTKISAQGEASLRSPRTLAGTALDGSGLDVSSGGFAKVVVRAFAIDASKAVESAAADFDTSFGGFTILPAGRKAAPIELNQVILTTAFAASAAPGFTIKASGKHETQDLFIEGDLSLPDLANREAGITADRLYPTGTIHLKSLPSTLASLFIGEETGLDRLVGDAVGPVVTVSMNSAIHDGNGRTLTLTAESKQLSARFNGTLGAKAFTLAASETKVTVTPEIAARIVDRFAPGTTWAPTLSGPSTLMLATSPVKVPLDGLSPRLEQAGEISVSVNVNGDLKPPVRESTQQASWETAVTAVRDVKLSARVPLSSLAKGVAPQPAEVTLAGAMYGDKGNLIADLDGGVRVNLEEARPVGDLIGSLSITVKDAATLDGIFGRPGVISGAVGESLSLRSSAVVAFATVAAADTRQIKAELSISSPRIATVQALKLDLSQSQAGLRSPLVLTWKPDPAWVNTHALQAQRAGAAMEPDSLRLTEPPEFTVRITKLIVPLGEDGPLLTAGKFAADVELTSPAVSIAAGKGGAVIKPLAVRAIGGHEPGVIGFSIRAEDLGAGGGPAGAPALLFQGGVYRIADEQGRPTPDAAVVSMTGDAFNAPSDVLDALANQNGLLAEILGPIVTVTVRTQGANQASGTLIVTANSPRAELELKGEFSSGRFIAEGEPKVILHSMTPELGKMLVEGMPFIGTFEKKPEDGPAQVQIKGLVVPLDGRLEQLNGDFIVDLGTARFASSGVFSTLLRLTNQRESGTVGRKLQPISLSIKDGVITYARWKLPLGDFAVDTRGTVDLVNRRMDVITYIPFGALTDEAAGKLNTGLGRFITGAVPLIEQATMVPFRTSGSFESPNTEADLELFATEAGRTLLRPDRLIREGLDKLLKPDDKK